MTLSKKHSISTKEAIQRSRDTSLMLNLSNLLQKIPIGGNDFDFIKAITEIENHISESQIIPITAGTGSDNKGLTIEKWIEAKSLFEKNGIAESDPSYQLYLTVTQNQLDDLLRTIEIASADYNTVRALVIGDVDQFMGFTFVRLAANTMGESDHPITWGLPGTAVSGGISRECLAWSKSYIKFTTPKDISMRIAERKDRCFNWYAYGRMSADALRIEDAGVVKIVCFEGKI